MQDYRSRDRSDSQLVASPRRRCPWVVHLLLLCSSLPLRFAFAGEPQIARVKGIDGDKALASQERHPMRGPLGEKFAMLLKRDLIYSLDWVKMGDPYSVKFEGATKGYKGEMVVGSRSADSLAEIEFRIRHPFEAPLVRLRRGAAYLNQKEGRLDIDVGRTVSIFGTKVLATVSADGHGVVYLLDGHAVCTSSPPATCLKEGEAIEVVGGEIVRGPYRPSGRSQDDYTKQFKKAFEPFIPWYRKPEFIVPFLAGAALGTYVLVDELTSPCCEVEVMR